MCAGSGEVGIVVEGKDIGEVDVTAGNDGCAAVGDEDQVGDVDRGLALDGQAVSGAERANCNRAAIAAAQ